MKDKLRKDRALFESKINETQEMVRIKLDVKAFPLNNIPDKIREFNVRAKDIVEIKNYDFAFHFSH